MTISHDSNNASNPVTYHGIPLTVLNNPASTIPSGQTVPHQPKKQRQVSIATVSQREDMTPAKKSAKGISLLTGKPADLHKPTRETIIYFIPRNNVIEIPSQGRTEVLNGATYVKQDSSHQIINPGDDPMSWCHQFKDGAGNVLVTPELNSYFIDHDKEVIKIVYDYFAQNITNSQHQKDYLKTMRALLRKYTNKIAANESRKRKAEAIQKQEDTLVHARNALTEARTLTDALESQLLPDFLHKDHPIHNTLSQLKAVLDSVPAD
ncbi:hypothetical protein [Kistimonas scapharcae]|uniref:hypothetical protein n=1 Tax=Kistimonas scapharcae TaxID=1036133 RepID=UPI0031E90638